MAAGVKHDKKSTERGIGNHDPYDLLKKCLPPLFKGGEKLSIGGGGITTIEFGRRRGEHFTDTGMKVYKKLLPFFGVTDPEEIHRAKGPIISRRNYLWSIELEGWVAFEDRLALKHGLRAIHATHSNHDNKPVETFWWP